MNNFAIQFNKNRWGSFSHLGIWSNSWDLVWCFPDSFGLIPSSALQVPSPLPPHQSANASLPLSTTGPVQKMEPLNNLQVRTDALNCHYHFIHYSLSCMTQNLIENVKLIFVFARTVVTVDRCYELVKSSGLFVNWYRWIDVAYKSCSTSSGGCEEQHRHSVLQLHHSTTCAVHWGWWNGTQALPGHMEGNSLPERAAVWDHWSATQCGWVPLTLG